MTVRLSCRGSIRGRVAEQSLSLEKAVIVRKGLLPLILIHLMLFVTHELVHQHWLKIFTTVRCILMVLARLTLKASWTETSIPLVVIRIFVLDKAILMFRFWDWLIVRWLGSKWNNFVLLSVVNDAVQGVTRLSTLLLLRKLLNIHFDLFCQKIR